jgi:hypothetical protein
MDFYPVASVIHNIQNNTPRSNKAQHTKLHNNKQYYTTIRKNQALNNYTTFVTGSTAPFVPCL